MPKKLKFDKLNSRQTCRVIYEGKSIAAKQGDIFDVEKVENYEQYITNKQASIVPAPKAAKERSDEKWQSE